MITLFNLISFSNGILLSVVVSILIGLFILERQIQKKDKKRELSFLIGIYIFGLIIYVLSILKELNLINYNPLIRFTLGMIGLIFLVFTSHFIKSKFNKRYLILMFIGGVGQVIINYAQGYIGDINYLFYRSIFFYIFLIFTYLFAIDFLWEIKKKTR